MTRLCCFDGCGRPYKGRGYCESHLQQLRRSGYVRPLLPVGLSLADRFGAKVDRSGSCHLWLGRLNRDGYGHINRGGGRGAPEVGAHRLAWELANGRPVPAGFEVDHRCHVRHCVKPDHLRLATHKQNMENQRGAQRGNRSGVRGAFLRKNGRFGAHVSHNGRTFWLGTYDSAAEAGAVAAAARAELFSHSAECSGVPA